MRRAGFGCEPPQENRRYHWSRFLEERVLLEPNTGCWLWTMAFDAHGYGRFNRRGRMVKAHRCSYEMSVGPIPDGLFVCHRCDTPACVRPDHLFLGTPADNMHDMMSKGRHRTVDQRGENNGNRKLTEAEVREIRSCGGMLREVAARYGVTLATISAVRLRKVWKDVP